MGLTLGSTALPAHGALERNAQSTKLKQKMHCKAVQRAQLLLQKCSLYIFCLAQVGALNPRAA